MDDGLMAMMETTVTSVPEANSSCAQNYGSQIAAEVHISVIAAFANHFKVNARFCLCSNKYIYLTTAALSREF